MNIMQLNVVVGKIQNRFINKKQTEMGGLNKEIEQLELEITRLKGQNKKLELDKQKLEEQLRLGGVSQQRELLFCDFCKEDNPHRKHEHKKMKECEGCGLITKL